MRISDWSSDVCSSDLRCCALRIASGSCLCLNGGTNTIAIASAYRANVTQIPCQSLVLSAAVKKCSIRKHEARLPNTARTPLVITMNNPCALARRHDRRSGVKGQRESVRDDLGGTRNMKTQTYRNTN